MEICFKCVAVLAVFLILLVNKVTSLECYVCENQDSNRDKCIKTSVQCEEYENMCATTIHWGLPPFWTPYGDRMHYVWKSCDTETSCLAKQKAMMPHCKRDWYDDWSCVECCAGDLCNYYATLGAGSLKVSMLFLLASCLTGLLLRQLT